MKNNLALWQFEMLLPLDGFKCSLLVTKPLFSYLKQTLDGGKAEAISLALELQAEWMLLDERDGRKKAKALGVQVTGVLGILLRAKEPGELSSLQPVIQELTASTGFRITPELLAKVVQV